MVVRARTLLPSVHDCARKIKAGFAAIKVAQSFLKHKKPKTQNKNRVRLLRHAVLVRYCLFCWCRRRDSNSHSFRHYPLKIACLPIPPRRQFHENRILPLVLSWSRRLQNQLRVLLACLARLVQLAPKHPNLTDLKLAGLRLAHHLEQTALIVQAGTTP
jgi:hypothetical protein